MNKKLFISLAIFFTSLASTALMLSACSSSEKKNKTTEEPVTEVQTETADSNIIPDFTLPDTDGNEMSAFSVIKEHKLTIIDFWASWCPPCVGEIPNIREIYSQYKDKGLGILSISLDKEESAWKEAIKKYEMNWNHVSDLKGWENAAARKFNVQSIPFMMIVDTEGKIVAKDVRGEALKTAIENYFK